jgi:hypothetical protein
MREKLIKIGAKVVNHGRYITLQMAELAVSRQTTCVSVRSTGSYTRTTREDASSMQSKPRVQHLSAVRLSLRPPAGHAEPYAHPASRLPEYPEDVG